MSNTCIKGPLQDWMRCPRAALRNAISDSVPTRFLACLTNWEETLFDVGLYGEEANRHDAAQPQINMTRREKLTLSTFNFNTCTNFLTRFLLSSRAKIFELLQALSVYLLLRFWLNLVDASHHKLWWSRSN